MKDILIIILMIIMLLTILIFFDIDIKAYFEKPKKKFELWQQLTEQCLIKNPALTLDQCSFLARRKAYNKGQ